PTSTIPSNGIRVAPGARRSPAVLMDLSLRSRRVCTDARSSGPKEKTYIGPSLSLAPGDGRAKTTSMSFHCEKRGPDHEGLPDVGMEYPDPYLAIPKDE